MSKGEHVIFLGNISDITLEKSSEMLLQIEYSTITLIFFSVAHPLNALEDVCTWTVLNLDAVFNGAGFVKPSGLEIAWEIIGLDKDCDIV